MLLLQKTLLRWSFCRNTGRLVINSEAIYLPIKPDCSD